MQDFVKHENFSKIYSCREMEERCEDSVISLQTADDEAHGFISETFIPNADVQINNHAEG